MIPGLLDGLDVVDGLASDFLLGPVESVSTTV